MHIGLINPPPDWAPEEVFVACRAGNMPRDYIHGGSSTEQSPDAMIADDDPAPEQPLRDVIAIYEQAPVGSLTKAVFGAAAVDLARYPGWIKPTPEDLARCRSGDYGGLGNWMWVQELMPKGAGTTPEFLVLLAAQRMAQQRERARARFRRWLLLKVWNTGLWHEGTWDGAPVREEHRWAYEFPLDQGGLDLRP